MFATRESHRWQGRDCWFALWLLCYVLCCLLILFAAFPWYCLRDASCGELTSMWSVSLSNNEEVPVQNDCGRTANMSMSLRKRRGGGRLSGFCFSSNIHASKKNVQPKISFRCNIHFCSFQEHLLIVRIDFPLQTALCDSKQNLEWCKFSQQVIFYASDRFWMRCKDDKFGLRNNVMEGKIPFVQSKMSKMWLGTWFWLKRISKE